MNDSRILRRKIVPTDYSRKRSCMKKKEEKKKRKKKDGKIRDKYYINWNLESFFESPLSGMKVTNVWITGMIR